MKGYYKHHFDRWYFENRWRQTKYQQPCDWTIVGISIRYASPTEYRYQISFFGLSINLWFKREWVEAGKL